MSKKSTCLNKYAIIIDMETPITQTEAWKKLQDDLKEVSFLEKKPDYQYLAILKKTPIGNYLYLPYGPVAKTNQAFKSALKSVETLAKSHNAIFTRIEPQNPEFKKSFPKNTKKSKEINPTHTLVISLEPSREEIFGAVPRRTRGYFNTYAKKGLTIEESKNPDDIKHLVALQKALAKDKKIGVFSEEYLKTQLSQPFASLYLVKYRPEDAKTDKVIAAVLIFDDEDTRYYIQAAQDKEYTKLAAPSIVVCQMLIDCIDKGIKYFDFWGIAPENAPKNHPWLGFTRFKKSFGGDEISYAGTYDIVLKPAKYKLYQLTRKINLLLRRI